MSTPLTAADLIRLDSRLDMATYHVRVSLVKLRAGLELAQPLQEPLLIEYRERLRALRAIDADLEQVGSEKSSSPAVGELKMGEQLV